RTKRRRSPMSTTIKQAIDGFLLSCKVEGKSHGTIDIGNLIKSKGAVFAALKSLIDYVGLGFKQLETIHLVGGFGSSLNISKAISIGLLPDIDINKIQYIGNSSIMGARMALLYGPVFEKAINVSKNMTNIELSTYVPFMNEFVAALFLPHTDSRSGYYS
ncbi:ASKHA domain-containing protein, partial [Chloroflexota bacterium]